YRALLGVLALSSLGGTAIVLALFGMRWLAEGLLRNRDLTMIALLAVPAIALTAFCASTLAAAREARRAAVVPAITAVAMLAAAAIGLPLAGLRGLYWASVAVSIVIAALVLRHLRRTLDVPGLAWVDPRPALARHPDFLAVYASNVALLFVYPLI